jgi:hypothetical protein
MIEGLVRVPRPHGTSRWATNIDSPEQVAKFEVQLQETMRELSAQLDNKMVCLQVLIRQANEKISQLEAVQLPLQAEHPLAKPETTSREESTTAMSTMAGDPLWQQIYTLAEEGFSPVTIAHRVARTLAEVEAILRNRTAP